MLDLLCSHTPNYPITCSTHFLMTQTGLGQGIERQYITTLLSKIFITCTWTVQSGPCMKNIVINLALHICSFILSSNYSMYSYSFVTETKTLYIPTYKGEAYSVAMTTKRRLTLLCLKDSYVLHVPLINQSH